MKEYDLIEEQERKNQTDKLRRLEIKEWFFSNVTREDDGLLDIGKYDDELIGSLLDVVIERAEELGKQNSQCQK